MAFDLKPTQARALLRLAFTPGGMVERADDLKPKLDTAERRTLEQYGLVATRKKRSVQIELTEQGWGWLSRNLSHQMPKGSELLADVLKTLDGYLRASQTSLAEFLRYQSEKPPEKPSPDLREPILREALAINGGRHERVRLSDLRARLAGIPRPDVDRALLELQSEGRITLFPIDLPSDRRPADLEASIQVAGEERHILYVR